MTTPNVNEDVEQQELSFTASGMESSTAILENSLAVSLKLNILLPYDPAITLLGIYPNELKTHIYLKKKPTHKCYSSFVHNCQNLEAIKMFFNR